MTSDLLPLGRMKAAIIGAGIAGLASAVRLRARGYEVDVYEANAYTGGKLTVIENSGYRWDAGPSLFTMPWLVDDLFVRLGEDPRSHFNYVRHDVSCKYFWPDGKQLTAWAGRKQFAEEVEKVWGEPADAVLDYLDRSESTYELTKSIFLESSLHKLKTMPRRDIWRALMKVRSLQLSRTLHHVNARQFKQAEVQQLFDRYATYNGSDPYKTPGVMHLIPHLEHGLGTYLPVGGMHMISQSIAALAERHGVRIHLNHPVDEISTEHGRASGIVVKGQFRPADLVVSNMDVVPTYRRLLKDQPAPEKTLRQERSSSALIFYWGMRQEFKHLDLHNIFFSKDYQREFREIFDDHVLPADPTIYVNITSKLEPCDAPAGCENWFVMINVPGDTGQNWDEEIPKAREQVIRSLSKALDVDISALIEREELLEPRTIASRTSSFQGSLYGASSNSKLSAFLRHPNFSRSIDNLFFCGGSVHPGGGIPLCLMSAAIVDSLVPDP